METPESVAVSTADIYPDVGVAQTRSVAVTAQGTTIAAAPLELATIIPAPIPHVTIEIRDTANRQLVTAIEDTMRQVTSEIPDAFAQHLSTSG